MSHTDRINKAIDSSSSAQSLISAVRGMMMQDALVPDGADLDGLCDAYLRYAIDLVREFSPVKGMYDSLLYKYDAANLKLCMKSSLRSLPYPLLFPYGTVPADKVASAVDSRDFSAFPDGLRRGCGTALEAYAKTGDPMNVDLEIDRGVFEDITDSAKKSGSDVLTELASLDADSANVTAYARICRLDMTVEGKRELFSRSFVCGGRIDRKTFPADMTAEALFAALSQTYLGNTLRPARDKDEPIPAIEDALRRRRSMICDRVRFVPFSADVPAAYIVEREAEVRAFTLISAYIGRGASQTEIRAALA